jgi:hypothetical protein
MADSPNLFHSPTAFCLAVDAAVRREPGRTTQVSHVLMGDCRLDSLVVCHDHRRADPGAFSIGLPTMPFGDMAAKEWKCLAKQNARQRYTGRLQRQLDVCAENSGDEVFPKESNKPICDLVSLFCGRVSLPSTHSQRFPAPGFSLLDTGLKMKANQPC